MSLTCGQPTVDGQPCSRSLHHTEVCRPLPTLQELLDFEAAEHKRARRIVLIGSQLGLTLARYHQLLNRAIDSEEALQYNPQITYQLRTRRQLGLRNRTMQPERNNPNG